MSRRVRVRFAPSPTGPLHPGGIRTALYNYLLAKQLGGDFILRVEDTDQNRFVPGAEEFIINALKWCGIEPNEGIGFGDGPHAPYRQSERKHLYREYADKLLASENAYYAFDTEEDIEKMRTDIQAQGNPSPSYNSITRQYMKNSLSLPQDEVEKRLASGAPYVIRFKMPRNEEVKFYDEIREWVSFNTSQLSDAVLLKSDGMPTYHLANVSDDYMMQITHVIRGEEWLSSAPLHVLLYRALGIEDVMPKFAHLPLLLKPDGNGKLSKRDGDRLGFPFYAINWKSPETGEINEGYREKGFFPEAFMNFLVLLGWNPGDNKEVLSMEEMIQLFTLEKVHKAGARYDYEKAKWYNHEWIKGSKAEGLRSKVKETLEGNGIIVADDIYLDKVITLVKDRCTLLSDFPLQSSFFFESPKQYDLDAVKPKWNEQKQLFFAETIRQFELMQQWNAPDLEKEFKEIAAASQIKPGDVLLPLRVMLVGGKFGPGVFDIAAVIGKKETIHRIKHLVDQLKG